MNRAFDVVVAGGGAIGASVAYHLTKAGAQVLLLDREAAGGRATRAAAGMLAAQEEAGADEVFLDHCLRSRALFAQLAPEVAALSGIDPEWAETGLARAAADPEEAAVLRAKAEAQAARGLPARWLSPDEAARSLPGFSVPHGAYLAPRDGVVNPLLWTRALLEAARRRGARVVDFTTASSLLTQSGRVTGVRTDRMVLRAGHVVLAAGAWTPFLLKPLGASPPLEPVKGQLLVLEGPAPFRTPVYAGDGYMVPRSDGRVLVGATAERAGYDETPTEDARRRLLAWAARWCPSLSSRSVAGVQVGLRPGSADGKPLVGPVPGWEGVSLACGHHRNGILLSPLTGRLVSDAVLSGDWSPAEAFAPSRFAVKEAQPA